MKLHVAFGGTTSQYFKSPEEKREAANSHYQARFDDGSDSDLRWGVPGNHFANKKIEFDQMFQTAWGQKANKYR